MSLEALDALDAFLAKDETQDVRVKRTLENLTAAVLEIAREDDIGSASVAELARRAGVSRTTFYQYADSPTELLQRILCAELDLVRMRRLRAIELHPERFSDLRREGMRDVMEHMIRYEDIYKKGRASSLLALRIVADHIYGSFMWLLNMDLVELPFDDQRMIPLFASFQSHGITATMESWLHLPEPRDIDLLLKALEINFVI